MSKLSDTVIDIAINVFRAGACISPNACLKLNVKLCDTNSFINPNQIF